MLLTERPISIQERIVLLTAELDETDGVLRSVWRLASFLRPGVSGATGKRLSFGGGKSMVDNPPFSPNYLLRYAFLDQFLAISLSYILLGASSFWTRSVM